MLKTTHPALFLKLTADDTAPDPVTKHRQKKVSEPGPHPKKKATEASTNDTEEVEEIEPPFTETGNFEDSCDVPIKAMIEHIVSEGKEVLEGVVEEENGGLVRIAEAEDPDIPLEINPEVKSEELGRGKRNRTSTARLHDKDWVYTKDDDVPDVEEGGSKKKRRKRQ